MMTVQTLADDDFMRALKISTRASNALRAGGILTRGDLTKLTFDKLLEVKGIGRRSAIEIRDSLYPFGLLLGMKETETTKGG